MKPIRSFTAGIALTALVAAGVYMIWLRPSKPATSTAEAHTDHGEEGHGEGSNKEVALTPAQFKASGIALGGFSSKNLSAVINANGYTKLPPQNQAEASIHVGGVVRSILVIEGQQVRAGQTLATVESPEYARLQESFLSAKSNLRYLSTEFQRQKALSEENINARKVYEKTLADYEVEQARYLSLQKQVAMLHLDSTGQRGAVVPVVAPIGGFVTEVNVKIGSTAAPGAPLFGIVDNTQMHVDLLVYEKDLQKVSPGQKVRFVLTNQDNTEIMGEIFSVGKAFENETKSVAVHADIHNDKQLLIPGMYVNALIDIGSTTVEALPLEAVVQADGKEFIFVLEGGEGHGHGEAHGHSHDEAAHADHDDHKSDAPASTYHFQRIEVKTGAAQLGYAQVTPLQPLDHHAQIVLKGAYYIQSHLLKNTGGGGHAH
jgi:cobalt-zinc-cadmium efflux system membrane fusion protein